MGSVGIGGESSEKRDPSVGYRMPAWNEALSQIRGFMSGGLPEFPAPGEEELNRLFSLTPTEQMVQESLGGLAEQGFMTPVQMAAGMTSLQNMGITPEQVMLPELTRIRRESLFGSQQPGVNIPGSIETTYGDLFSRPVGPSEYMQKLTRGAWGDLGTRGMEKASTMEDLLRAQSTYQDIEQQAQMIPSILALQGAGAAGLSRAMGAPGQIQAMQTAIPMFQFPYELDLARRMTPLAWQRGQFEAENALWNLALQMMGAAPAGASSSGMSYSGAITG